MQINEETELLSLQSAISKVNNLIPDIDDKRNLKK